MGDVLEGGANTRGALGRAATGIPLARSHATYGPTILPGTGLFGQGGEPMRRHNVAPGTPPSLATGVYSRRKVTLCVFICWLTRSRGTTMIQLTYANGLASAAFHTAPSPS